MRDLEAFLAPAAGGSPSGADLRNDPRFHALERLLEPAARRPRLERLRDGGTGDVAVDWEEILAASGELATEGRDLRLLVIVARAVTNDAGFAGLAAGLTLLAETVGRNWDDLHPALRAAATPREAAVRRINALYQIENEENGLLGDLLLNTVIAPRGIGPVSGGDLAAAMLNRSTVLAEAPSGLGDKEQAALLAGHEARQRRVTVACRAAVAEQPEALAVLAHDVEGARAALGALEQALGARVGANGAGVRFTALGTFLSRVAATLAAAQPDAPGAAEIPDMAQPIEDPRPAAAPSVEAAAVPGRLNSRKDVERCLDQIIDFYERTEPSSPIPHLARRMRKMVPMNFLELMEEIAPSGMKEFRSVAGVTDDRSKRQE